MAHYDKQGRFIKGRRLDRPAPLRDETPVNTSPIDGQNLLVRPDVKCAECRSTPGVLVNLGGRLLCRACYGEARGGGEAEGAP